MAFNNDPGIRAPKYQPTGGASLDLSRTLASIGDMVSNIFTVKDGINQQNIEDEIRRQKDVSDNIFGVGDATTIDAASGAPSKVASSDVPEEINAAGDRLSALKEAMANGKLRESNYYARMNSVVRELKARYPGYESVIDQKAGAVIGVNPANALRRELMSESQKEATTRDAEEKRWQTFVDQNAKYLPSNWKALSREEIRDVVYKSQKAEHDVTVEKSSLELKRARNESNEDDEYNAASKELSTMTNDAMYRATDGGSFKDIVSQARNATSDGIVSPQEDAALRQAIGNYRTSLNMKIDEILNRTDERGNSYRNRLPAAKADELRKMYMSQVDQLEADMTNKNYGALAWNKARIDAVKDSDTHSMQMNSKDIRNMSALRSLGGDSLVGNYYMQNISKIDKAVTAASVGSAVWDAAANGSPLSKVVEDTKGLPPKEREKALSASFDTIRGILSDPNAPDSVVSNLVKSLYATDRGDLRNVIPPNQWAKMFGFMTTPQIMDQIQKKAPDQWKQYTEWSKSTFYYTFKNDIDTLKHVIQNTDTKAGAAIRFDGKQFYIDEKAVPETMTVGGPGLPARTPMPMLDVRKAIESINIGLGAFSNVVKRDGQNPEDILPSILMGAQINPRDPNDYRSRTWAQSLYEAVGDWFHSQNTDSGKGVIEGQNTAPKVLPFPQGGSDVFGTVKGRGPLNFLPQEGIDLNKIQNRSGAADAVNRMGSNPDGFSINPDLMRSSSNVDWRGFDSTQINPELTSRLNTVASALPFPVIIRSGLRSPTDNQNVGGARGSQHLDGNAVDIDLRGLSDDDRISLVANLVSSGVGRIGAYSGNTGLHVDMGSVGKDRPDYKASGLAAYPMFDRSFDNYANAPSWFKKGMELGSSMASYTQPEGTVSPDGAYKFTGYSPQEGGHPMEGGYEAAKPGPDGKSVVRTAEDFRTGNSQYVTLAGNPSEYGKEYTFDMKYQINGKTYVLKDVKGVVHDTGKAFANAPTNRFDVAVANNLSKTDRNKSPIVGNVRQENRDDASSGAPDNVKMDFLGWLTGNSEPKSKMLDVSPETGLPSDEDVTLAKRSGFGYGSNVENYISGKNVKIFGFEQSVPAPIRGNKNNTTKVFVPTKIDGALTRIVQVAKDTHGIDLTDPKNKSIADDLGNSLIKQSLVINRIPLATIGFDPNKITIEAAGGKYNLGGFYTPSEDQIVSMGSSKTNLIHESIHRGLEIIGKTEKGKALIDEAHNFFSFQNDETLVRYLMFKYTNDGESGVGSESDKQIATMKNLLKVGADGKAGNARAMKTLDAIDAYAAEYLSKKHPGGPR